MQKFHVKACALFLSISAIGAQGCGSESVLTAGSKVLGGQISELTANEILALNQSAIELISQVTGVPATPMTTPQAVALSNFFQLNQLNTFADIEALILAVQTDPESVKGLYELAAAFEGSGYGGKEGQIDPGNLTDLFGSIFGGVESGGGDGPGGPRGPGGPQPGLN